MGQLPIEVLDQPMCVWLTHRGFGSAENFCPTCFGSVKHKASLFYGATLWQLFASLCTADHLAGGI